MTSGKNVLEYCLRAFEIAVSSSVLRSQKFFIGFRLGVNFILN